MFLRPGWNRDFSSSAKMSDVKQGNKREDSDYNEAYCVCAKGDQRKQYIILESFRSGS